MSNIKSFNGSLSHRLMPDEHQWIRACAQNHKMENECKKSFRTFTCVSVRLSVFASAFRSDPTTYWLPSNAFSNSSSCIGWNAVRIRFGFRYGCKKISTREKRKKWTTKILINRFESVVASPHSVSASTKSTGRRHFDLQSHNLEEKKSNTVFRKPQNGN